VLICTSEWQTAFGQWEEIKVENPFVDKAVVPGVL